MPLPSLNKTELVVGAVIPLALVEFLGPMTFIIIIPCAFLWAYGGAESTKKLWRRLGVGVIISIALAMNLNTLTPLFSIPLFLAASSIGYGIPGNGDEGSTIGRFWFNLLKKKKKIIESNRNLISYVHNFLFNEEINKIINFLTRMTCAFFMGLAFLPLAFISISKYIFFLLTLSVLVPFVNIIMDEF